MRLGRAWRTRLRVAWAELARGRAIGSIWGADDARGATGRRSFARGLQDEGRARTGSAFHTRLGCSWADLSWVLAKVGHRRCGLAGGGLVGTRFVRRGC